MGSIVTEQMILRAKDGAPTQFWPNLPTRACKSGIIL